MKCLLATVSGLLVSATMATAQPVALPEDVLSHPNPSIVAAYEANSENILSLYGTVINLDAGENERLAAFEELAIEYPIVSEVAARDVINDEATSVALFAVQLLKGSVVMSDHQMPSSMEGLSPLVSYIMQSHRASRNALRTAVTDPREELRGAAAGFLASLSDMETLTAISENPELYSASDAVSLITLASGEDGLALLEQYLETEDQAARALSVEYLAAIPEYQARIRSEVFLNSDTDDVVRQAAASSLGIYDNEFANYALIVAGEENLSPELYQSVVGNYVDQIAARGELSPNAANSIASQIDSQLTIYQGISEPSDAIRQIESIQRRLDAISRF